MRSPASQVCSTHAVDRPSPRVAQLIGFAARHRAPIGHQARLFQYRIEDGSPRARRHARFVGLCPGAAFDLEEAAHIHQTTHIIMRPLKLSTHAGRQLDVSLWPAGGKKMSPQIKSGRPGCAAERLSRRSGRRTRVAELAGLPSAGHGGHLLGPVFTDRHNAPSPSAPARAMHEQKRTGRTLAGLHILEIFAAEEG